MSDMPRCGTCQHWTAPTRPYQGDHGDCEVIVGNGWETDEVAYTSSHDGDGGLVTKADFGCVLHAPR